MHLLTFNMLVYYSQSSKHVRGARSKLPNIVRLKERTKCSAFHINKEYDHELSWLEREGVEEADRKISEFLPPEFNLGSYIDYQLKILKMGRPNFMKKLLVKQIIPEIYNSHSIHKKSSKNVQSNTNNK